MRLTKEDIEQIQKKGLSEEKIEEQLKVFERGNIPVNIEAAATVDYGIKQYSEKEKKEFQEFYSRRKDRLDILKFIPASGAATRMFKALHVFLQEFDPKE